MNLTRQQLINHCLDAIKDKKYLLVRWCDQIEGLNPHLAKIVMRKNVDKHIEIQAQSIVRQCGINEYLNYKCNNSFTGKLLQDESN